MSLGEIALHSLRTDPQAAWFALGYDRFEFNDDESYRQILSAQRDFGRLEFAVFIGLWCPDCHEHFPGFARVLDAVKFPPDRLRVYSLDRAKAFPGGEGLIAGHRITRLPTFILFEEGNEVGRITETPEPTLLKDLARLLARR